MMSATSLRTAQARATRRVTSAAPTVATMPTTLAIASEAEATTAPAPSRSVHRGAVEPAMGTPGL